MDFNISNKQLRFPENIMVSYPKDIKQLHITWNEVITDDINITKIGYNIYRGSSMNGIFYKLNKSPILENKYVDKSIALNPNNTNWYKLSTVAIFKDGTESEGKLSTPVIYEVKNENRWFIKMNERNMWILKNTGVLMDLYVRKTTGERCPDCYDEVRGQSFDSNCPKCFGTGFIGGYEPMTQLYVRQKPAVQQLEMQSKGYMINSNPGLWTISKIKLHNRDLLINQEGRIFSITSSNISHAAGFYFHQEFQSKEIDPNDNRYNIKRKNLCPDI